ncbi:hypothetical protein Tco_0006408 [Tanacetum coccineum]
MSQSSGPTTLVADETVYEEMGDSMERAAITATSLDAEQDSGNIIITQSMATLNEPIPQGTGLGSGPRRQDTILGDRPAQTRFERFSKQSNDPHLSRVNTLGSGDDILKIMELMEIYSQEVGKERKARTPQFKRRLLKVRIESSADKSLGDQEDASKQGRNIAESDQDEEISFVQEDAETQGRYDHDIDVTTASTPITTAGVSVSTAEPSTPPTTTILIEDEDLTIAQTLMKMKSEKSKEKLKEKGVSSETALKPTRGVTIQESSESRTRQPVPPPQHDPKDKGKAKMIEPEKPSKKKDQIKLDEEMAKRLAEELEAELEEEEKLAKQREEEANLISWDNTQAMMEADYELAQRLQAEEQGELTIEERSKLFVELMDKRKKHFAKLRAEEIRRKPPTKAQKRNQMCTYLKNMANYKHSQLKNKSFEEIQMLFDNAMKWIDSFVPMDSEVVEGSKSQAEGKDDAEKAKLKACLKIVPKDDEAINVESLATKYPIVDWKTHILTEDKMYYEIIRADGSTKFYKIFTAMLDDFDKQDVLDLYRLVKERFETTSPEGYDRLL